MTEEVYKNSIQTITSDYTMDKLLYYVWDWSTYLTRPGTEFTRDVIRQVIVDSTNSRLGIEKDCLTIKDLEIMDKYIWILGEDSLRVMPDVEAVEIAIEIYKL